MAEDKQLINSLATTTTLLLLLPSDLVFQSKLAGPLFISSVTCSDTELLRTRGTGFRGLDVLPVTQPTASKHTGNTDSIQWPDRLLSSSTTALLTEGSLLLR